MTSKTEARPAMRATASDRRGAGLRIVQDDTVWPILRLWETGLAVASENAPGFRGFVDIYDGDQHIFQCLIVRLADQGDETQFEFKRLTAIRTTPPPDFAPVPDDADRPVAAL